MKKLLLFLCYFIAAIAALGQGTAIRSNNGVGTNTTLYGTTTTSALQVNGNADVTGTLGASGIVTFGNNLLVTGNATATGFIGSGANVTSLNANNLASGTVPTARLGSGTANSSTILYGDSTWGAAPSSVPTNNLVFSRWERQEPTSSATNFNFSVTNNSGRMMYHYVQILATNDVMLHPDCYTNAALALEIVASGAARRVSFSTNLAQLNTTGLALQSTGGTNWFVDVTQNGIFIATIKTNEYFGRRVMTWRTNVW